MSLDYFDERLDPLQTVHECLFCSQTFATAVEKDEHTLEHFTRQTCIECRQNLVRIGGNLYTLHNEFTCIKRSSSPICHIKSDIKPETIDNDSENQKGSLVPIIAGPSETQQIEPHPDFETKGQSDGDDEDFDGDSELIDIEMSREQREFDVKEEEEESIVDDCSEKTEVRLNDSNVKICTPAKSTVHRLPRLPSPPMVDGRFKCDICNGLFNRKSDVKAHKIRIHKILGDVVCKVCRKIFASENEMIEHRTSCKKSRIPIVKESRRTLPRLPSPPMVDGRYECDTCNGLFKTKENLRGHKIKVHKVLGEVVCNVCKRLFPTENEMFEHRLTCKKSKNRSTKPVRKPKPDNSLYKCDLCESTFQSVSNKRAHVRFVHLKVRDYICDECGKAFRKMWELNDHKQVHQTVEKVFKCLHCEKLFATAFQRTRHIYRLHKSKAENINRKFICDHCKASYNYKNSLTHHIQIKHLNISKYKCNVCHKVSTTINSFNLHKLQHTGEKPFACQWVGCGKEFRAPANRAEHMRTHTGEKPYACSFQGCDKRFRFAIDFRRHKTKAHSTTEAVDSEQQPEPENDATDPEFQIE